MKNEQGKRKTSVATIRIMLWSIISSISLLLWFLRGSATSLFVAGFAAAMMFAALYLVIAKNLRAA